MHVFAPCLIIQNSYIQFNWKIDCWIDIMKRTMQKVQSNNWIMCGNCDEESKAWEQYCIIREKYTSFDTEAMEVCLPFSSAMKYQNVIHWAVIIFWINVFFFNPQILTIKHVSHVRLIAHRARIDPIIAQAVNTIWLCMSTNAIQHVRCTLTRPRTTSKLLIICVSTNGFRCLNGIGLNNKESNLWLECYDKRDMSARPMPVCHMYAQCDRLCCIYVWCEVNRLHEADAYVRIRQLQNRLSRSLVPTKIRKQTWQVPHYDPSSLSCVISMSTNAQFSRLDSRGSFNDGCAVLYSEKYKNKLILWSWYGELDSCMLGT